MKFVRFIAVLLVACLALCACAFAEGEKTPEEYEAIIADLEAQIADLTHQLAAKDYIAEFDGGYVLASEAMAQYEYMLYMLQQYGYSTDGYEDQFKQDIASNMAQAAVEKVMANKLGLDVPTAEEEAQLKADAEVQMLSYVQNYRSEFESEDLSEEEIVAATKDFLAENGITEDSLYETVLTGFAQQKLFEYAAQDVTVTDEEIKAEYDSLVASDEAAYADPTAYDAAVSSDTTIYWHPEGYRNVKQVLVAFSNDQRASCQTLTSRIQSLNDELAALETAEDKEGLRTADEINVDLQSANDDLNALYEELAPTVEEVLSQYEAGLSFDELVVTYGGDPGSVAADGTVNTYVISEASSMYDSAFHDAAMSLTEIGQVSEPAPGMYGIYIVLYDSDVTPGAVPFEDVQELVADLALDAARDQAYSDQMAAWCEELNLVYYMENFR